MAADASLLLQIPLFSTLSDADRATLATHVDEEHFQAGDSIFVRGDPGGSVYVICAGRVELSVRSDQGDRITLETAEAGNFFGELSLLDGEPRSADANALDETHCLRVDREDLLALFRVQADTALSMLNVMARRLRQADMLMRSRPERSPNQQVAHGRTFLERTADKLSEFSGSFSFLALHIIWFAIWVVLNVDVLPNVKAFDPFPFGLLTMIVSLEAIMLSCFLLISQNRTAAQDRIRSDVEYTANIKAGLEVSQLHVKLDQLYAHSMQRLERLERHAQLSPPTLPAARSTRYPV